MRKGLGCGGGFSFAMCHKPASASLSFRTWMPRSPKLNRLNLAWQVICGERVRLCMPCAKEFEIGHQGKRSYMYRATLSTHDRGRFGEGGCARLWLASRLFPLSVTPFRR